MAAVRRLAARRPDGSVAHRPCTGSSGAISFQVSPRASKGSEHRAEKTHSLRHRPEHRLHRRLLLLTSRLNLYVPFSLVVALRAWFVSVFVAVTVAPPITAP